MREFSELSIPSRPLVAAAADCISDSAPPAPTVLIVEDEVVVTFFLKALFEEKGFEVVVATTAQEALLLVEEHAAKLGAAIIDVGLPDAPGDQLVPHIRTTLPKLPILIATGFSETEFSGRFEADEHVRVIGKPFDAPQLWLVLGSLDQQFDA